MANLASLMDEDEAAQERLPTPYHRLDRIWERENAKNWRLFKRIVRTRAETLQGAAAQLKVIEPEGALTNSHGDGVMSRFRKWRATSAA
jgi:hypothetical protein